MPELFRWTIAGASVWCFLPEESCAERESSRRSSSLAPGLGAVGLSEELPDP